jgi:hypothetical protein
LPHVIIFDSWRHLFRLLNETDVALVRQRMHAGQPERAAAASRAWNNELTAMQVAWKKNPARALRFSDYDSAMRTLYGRSTVGHDDASYVVSRMGREYNLTRLRAFQPYDGHPEATVPLSLNGITHAHTITLMVLGFPSRNHALAESVRKRSRVCARAHTGCAAIFRVVARSGFRN